jgi:S-DNA-T family DNA segregation ATPase FtsK/SpoIIIE
VDQLEGAGIVGQYDGSKAREVLVESEAELDMLLNGEGEKG